MAPMHDDDSELVAAALGRSASARRRLAERLLGVIHREVLTVLGRHAGRSARDPRQEAHDMIQEVLVTLFEHDARELRRWDPARGRSLDSFVRLVARRRVARILGQRRGNPWAIPPLDPQTIDDDGGGAGDDDLVSKLESRDELDALLDALYAHMGPRDVELFDLLFVEERDPAEVAEALGMSRQAVNAWSYRTRKLARRLAEAAREDSVSAARPETTKEMVDHGR